MRLRTDTPTWWNGRRWVSYPNATQWAHPGDAVISLVEQLGPTWGHLAMLQCDSDAADEWALWFAEVWLISCTYSQLDPVAACTAPPAAVVAEFLAGIMSGQGVDAAAMSVDAAATAQRWAAWSLERRSGILADLDAP